MGQALGDGGFAYAGFTNEAGVVLLAAVQDLDHPLDLLLPADDRVQLAVLGPLGQGDAVALQILPLSVLGFLLLPAPAGSAALVGALTLGHVTAREQAVQEGEGGGLAIFLVAVLVSAGQVLNIFHAAHGLHHLIADGFQVLIRDTHALHHVIHLRQAQVLGAFQAQALVNGLITVQP